MITIEQNILRVANNPITGVKQMPIIRIQTVPNTIFVPHSRLPVDRTVSILVHRGIDERRIYDPINYVQIYNNNNEHLRSYQS